jgi:hypothetical protein
MSLSHEQLRPEPILSNNRQWIHNRKVIFWISLGMAVFDSLLWLDCSNITPVTKFLFWTGLIIPLLICLYLGSLALKQLELAVCTIESLESERPIVVDKFTLPAK